MSIEKSFNDFIILYEKNLMIKDIDLVEKSIFNATERALSVLGEEQNESLTQVSNNLLNSLKEFKKVLNKHKLYELPEL